MTELNHDGSQAHGREAAAIAVALMTAWLDEPEHVLPQLFGYLDEGKDTLVLTGLMGLTKYLLNGVEKLNGTSPQVQLQRFALGVGLEN